MEISADIYLRGDNWKKALEGLKPFFPDKSMQPNYSIYLISMAIGVMYDQQLDIAGHEDKNDEVPSVPRTVLHNHSSELEFLFQTAILTSKLSGLDKKEKMDLAFNANSEIEFKKFDFLTKFANYGVGVLLEHITDNPIKTMENIKEFVVRTFEGKNYGVYGVADSDLDVEDLS